MKRNDRNPQRMGIPILALLFWVPFLAEAEAQEERDSPGKDNDVPVTVEENPFLILGRVEGKPEEEFYQIVTPFRLPSGRIVVPLRSLREIRVFSSKGDLERTFGGQGEGPGEFRNLTAAWPCGDTLEAFDGSLMRMTRFHPAGEAETVPFDIQAAGFRSSQVIPGSLGGTWLLGDGRGAGAGGRDEIPIVQFDREGEHVGIITSVSCSEVYSAELSGMRILGPTPISPNCYFAINQGRLFVAETLTPEIRVRDLNGSLLMSVAWTPEPVGVSPRTAVQQVIDAAVERADPEKRDSRRKFLESAPTPEKVPVFSTFLVDDLGFTWVRPFEILRDAFALRGSPASKGAGGSWWIFDPEGRKLGAVELPADLLPQHVGEDFLLGIRQDELGVEYVDLHRLYRKGGRGATGG